MRKKRAVLAAGVAVLLTYASVGTTSAAASAPQSVTRAQFIYQFDRADNISPVYPQTPDFTDVPSSSPYYGYIEAAYKAGIISGVRTGIFDPNGYLTREEIAKIEVLALGDGAAAQALLNQPTSFTDDATIPSWARGYINEAVKLGLISGYPNGTFRSSQTLTTADAPHFLQKFSVVAGAQGTWTVGVTPSASDAAVGQQVQLATTVKNPQGNAVSGAQVTYSVNSASALIAGSTFIASSPGNYIVTATYLSNGVSATGTAQIAVFGSPTSLKINVPSSIAANGYSQSTVTVDVLDQNGNIVGNDNVDQISLTATGSGAVSAINPGTATTVDGVATFTITSGLVPGSVSTLTAVDTQIPGSGDTATATVTSSLQSAASLSVSAPQYISSNASGTAAVVKIQVLDQSGQPMLYGVYGFTVSLSGPGTFAGGSTTAQNLVYSGNGQSGANAPYATVTIYDIQAETGPITITATGPTLNSGSATTTAVIAGSPVGISMTPPATASFSQDNGGTGLTYGISAVDAHGYPVSDAVPVLITVKNSSGALATNIRVDGQPQSTTDGGFLDTYAMANGEFTLTEIGATQSVGAYTVQATSPTNLLSSSAVSSFEITAGALAGIQATMGSNYVSALNPQTTLTVQLVDANGNPVDQSGIPVTLTSPLSNTYPVTLGTGFGYTNASGQVVSTVQVPPYVGLTYTIDVTATIGGRAMTPAIEPTFSVQDTVASNVSVAFSDLGAGPNSSGQYVGSGYVAASSDHVTLTLKALDQYQNPVKTNDQVTVSFAGGGSLSNPTYAGSGAAVPVNSNGQWTLQLSGGQTTIDATAWAAGQLAVEAQDTSISNGPTGTTTVMILPGNVTSFDFFSATGQNLSTPAASGGTGIAVQANTPVEVYLKPVDAQGNATVAPQAATAVLSDGNAGGSFRPQDPYNANIVDYTVPAGSSEVPFWYVNGVSGTYYLSAGYQQLPATVSLSSLPTSVTAGQPQKVTLTAADQYGHSLNGTYPVEITAPSGGLGLLAQSPDAQYAIVGTVLSGGSITNGITLDASGRGVISLTFSAGTADLYVLPIDAQQNASFNLQVNGTSNITSSGNVDVVGGAPYALASATAPTGSTVVGSAYNYQLNAVDQYGNPANGSFGQTITLTVGGLLPSLNAAEPSAYGTAATTTTGSNPVTTVVIPTGTQSGDLGALTFLNDAAALPVTLTAAAKQTLTFELGGTTNVVTANASETPDPGQAAYAIVVAPSGTAPVNTVNLVTPAYAGGPWTLSTVQGATYGADVGSLTNGDTYNGVIQLVDQYGNAITSGTDASAQITLTLAPGTNSGSYFDLPGSTTGTTQTLTLANGAAAFTYYANGTSGSGPWTDTLTISKPTGGTGTVVIKLTYQ